MLIRKSKNADSDQLFTLIKEFYIDFKEKTFSSPFQALEAYKSGLEYVQATLDAYLSHSEYITYVAEVDGKLRGYIVGEIRPRTHKVLDKEGYIKDWFVRKDFRTHGIGGALFEQMTKDLIDGGCTHLMLDTLAENATAITIYHKMGFTDRALTLIKPL